MLKVGGAQREERWKVATSGQYRPHAMGRNACVFVGEWKSKGKEERGRQQQEEEEERSEEGGIYAKAAAWLCVWMKGLLSLLLSLLLSVCIYGLHPLQQVSTCPEQTERDSPSDFKLGVNILQKLRLKLKLSLFKKLGCFLGCFASRKLLFEK